MLIETVADQRFAQAVETIAEALTRGNNRRQYIIAFNSNIYNCGEVTKAVDAISKAGGTVERIDSNNNGIYILYRAEKPVDNSPF